MATILCVLYDDPVDGYPTSYRTRRHPENRALSRRSDDPDAAGSRLHARRAARQRFRRARLADVPRGPRPPADRHLRQGRARLGVRARAGEAEIVISQPFWPAYLTAERIAKAPNLKLAITAGIGSDHVDLQAAIDRGITVTEVTYSNSISVAEHVVMMILVARSQLPSVAPMGARRRLEHRRLRLALLRPGRNAGGNGCGRAHRLGGAAAAEAVRRRAALHRSTPPVARGRSGARGDVPPERRVAWSASATWSRSTLRSIPRPSTSSTTS